MNETDAAVTLHGSAYLLQESVPTRLIGSVAGETSPMGPGRVRVAFSDEDPMIRSTCNGDQVTLKVEESFALELAKRMLHMVAQNRALREVYHTQSLRERDDAKIAE